MLDRPASHDRGIAALSQVFGTRVLTGQAIREQHGHTTSWIANQPPDAVFAPKDVTEVQRVVTLCSEYRMPIIPFGAGTSLEAQLNAPDGGISLDMSGMNSILAVNADDLDAVVQPGIEAFPQALALARSRAPLFTSHGTNFWIGKVAHHLAQNVARIIGIRIGKDQDDLIGQFDQSLNRIASREYRGTEEKPYEKRNVDLSTPESQANGDDRRKQNNPVHSTSNLPR